MRFGCADFVMFEVSDREDWWNYYRIMDESHLSETLWL